jgi:transposase-like protein
LPVRNLFARSKPASENWYSRRVQGSCIELKWSILTTFSRKRADNLLEEARLATEDGKNTAIEQALAKTAALVANLPSRTATIDKVQRQPNFVCW